MSNAEKIRILSPATGQLVPLDQVPDPVFSQKIIGDGIAVIPSDETIVSPVDGEVVSIAETLHAYGFRTKEGVELLIHIGLETVALKGACFKPLVKVGDQVKAGTPVAEVDLNFLKEKELNPITPILICGGAEGLCLSYGEGSAKAGETEVLVLSASAKENPAQETTESTKTASAPKESSAASGSSSSAGKNDSEEKKDGKKIKINFDFLQKLGKVLMAVIAVMPAAGLMISLGKLVQMAGADMHMIFMVGSTMENIG